MIFHVLERLKYQGETTGYIVQAVPSGKIMFLTASQAMSCQFDNAVICSNGVLRGKSGIPDKIVYDEKTWAGQKTGYFRLYHGSPNEAFTPTYGYGDDKHDYGKGFYLTPYAELAKEWAMCLGNSIGYLHMYLLRLDGLSYLNFNSLSELSWLAELMKHRDASDSARYKRFAGQFIAKYGVDISGYDFIYGWRADSSYFVIAKRFVRDEIDYNLLGRLFKLGDLENQICLKSAKAFSSLIEYARPVPVPTNYADKYWSRDRRARDLMKELIDSPENTMTRTFSSLLK